MDYIQHLLILAAVYGALCAGLNLASGLTGLISAAQAAFFGIGAYTAAILATRHAWPLWATLPSAVLVCAIAALPLALVARRVVDDAFLLCTLAMNVVFYVIMNNWDALTRGSLGISGIPAGLGPQGAALPKSVWLLLATLILAANVGLTSRLASAPFGRVLRGLREDEIFTQSLGKDVAKAKMQAFMLGSMMAAAPGVLYAHYVSFVDPSSFTTNESIFILAILIIGGLGNVLGGTAAAVFLVLATELLRFVNAPAHAQQVLSGLLLVAILHWRRGGAEALKMRGRRSLARSEKR